MKEWYMKDKLDPNEQLWPNKLMSTKKTLKAANVVKSGEPELI